MSDEIKVNSELPQKLATLGQVKDALDKRDEKIDSLKEDISNKITKFYASSQGETHLSDSDNGKIMDMMLYGKSEQKQYSGKNLIDVSEGLEVIGNKTYTIAVEAGKSYTITLSQTLKAASSIGGQVAQHWFKFYDSSEKILSQNNFCSMNFSAVGETLAKTAVLLAPVGAVKLILDISGYYNANPTLITNYMQLELGSESTPYEPYTGGIPSPNPDYPQEIKSVVNPTVKVCGKNIINGKRSIYNAISFEIDKVVIKDNAQDYGEVFAQHTLKKGTYTISCECNYINRIEIVIDGIAKPVVNKASNSYTFTVDKDSSAKFTVVVFGDVTDGVDYIQLEKGSVATPYEPYHEQTITLPYTLNAIPVSSGGNVTINGQQYIADYVDVERGKVVKRVKVLNISNLDKSKWEFRTDMSGAIWQSTRYYGTSSMLDFDTNINAMSNIAIYGGIGHDAPGNFRLVNNKIYLYQFNLDKTKFDKVQDFVDYLVSNNVYIQYALKVPQELDLKPEEMSSFKALSTNYPVTNIEVSSEQLDGYTVFNYPISMANGWDYVKKQLNDNRDYIYDMDMQSAEAYVNSEYAVALTELEV